MCVEEILTKSWSHPSVRLVRHGRTSEVCSGDILVENNSESEQRVNLLKVYAERRSCR